MKERFPIIIFLVAQSALLVIELFTSYDTFGRQNALALTNVVSVITLLFFDRWLRRRGSRLARLTFVLAAGAVWLDALGNFQHLYAGFWWWDRLTHAVGGMALSAVFIDFFLSYRATGKLQAGWGWAAWMGVLVGQLVGSLYEISEWLGDFWFDTHRVQGPYDTPHDLFQNLVGGLVVLVLMRMFRRRAQ
ncbi:MAG: hypothetical protein AAB402_01060 [Patescibacteria group bacterium]